MDIINELVSGKPVFLEDLADMYGSGDIDKPTRVVLTDYESESGSGMIEMLAIVEENRYAGFDGMVHLDLRSAVSGRVFPEIPDSVSSPLLPKAGMNYAELTIEFGDTYKNLYANCFSSDAKTMISEIDYLSVPKRAKIIVNVWDGFTSCKLFMERNGRETELLSETGLLAIGYGYRSYLIDTAAYSIGSVPFRFIVHAMNGSDETVMASPYYRCVNGDFEEYLFYGRLGGFVYFPISGNLEMSMEYEFQNAQYHGRKSKVSGIGEPVMSQHAGGLTAKAAKVLSELLLSDHVYHKSGGEWKRIIIDKPEVSIISSEYPHSVDFSFRYE